eukprot:TRINITY_DN2435_c0_g1_i1.p1 TRINITY_DN2435_c0_g1~~TRINITY_DN2435_c0_g1_i1.p1  ORF type:complete len:420 (+),score=96.89 TRINITY_DN2435_c0_g1_i1:1072-2331(+)
MMQNDYVVLNNLTTMLKNQQYDSFIENLALKRITFPKSVRKGHIATLSLFESEILHAIKLSRKEQMVFATDYDVGIWDTNHHLSKALNLIEMYNVSKIDTIDLSCDEITFGTNGNNGTILLFETTKWDFFKEISLKEKIQFFQSSKTDSNVIYCFCNNNYIIKYDFVNENILNQAHFSNIETVTKFFLVQGIFWVGCHNGELLLIDEYELKLKKRIQAHSQSIRSICFFPNLHTVVTGGFDERTVVWRYNEVFDLEIFVEYSFASTALSTFGDSYILSGDLDGTLFVLNIFEKEIVQLTTVDMDGIFSIYFDENSENIYVAGGCNEFDNFDLKVFEVEACFDKYNYNSPIKDFIHEFAVNFYQMEENLIKKSEENVHILKKLFDLKMDLLSIHQMNDLVQNGLKLSKEEKILLDNLNFT